MCGIAGIISIGKIDISDKVDLENMLERMRHRGPDGTGIRIFDNTILGHNRLSIIDLEKRSDQPLSYLDDRYWIVFNGEKYNYLELKNELEKCGYIFKTTSDTEVILAAYDKWKDKCFNKFNGMFSICIFNKKNNDIVLVRDRYGVKPLYYYLNKDKLYFASEIKSFFGLKKRFKLNQKSIELFIKQTISDDQEESYVTGVKQVMGGCLIKVKKTKKLVIKKRKWYFGNDYIFDKNIFFNKNQTLTYFEDLLVNAIKIRYRADVPVCLTLSGGIDSTVIYILTKERINQAITPFTYRHPGSKTDEYKIVSKLVDHYKDKVEVVTGNKNTSVKDLEKTLYYLEFPIWNPSGIAYFDMYQKIRKKGYRVVLEGHGSDEQLGGYPYMIEEAWKEFMYKFNIKKAYMYFDIYKNTVNNNLIKRNFLLKNFLARLVKFYIDIILNKNQKYSFNSKVNLAFNKEILPMVLRAFDRLSMANSLESRSPYLDYRIVEFIKSMPIDYKVNRLGTKAILREILKKYGFDFIYKNKIKTGFAVDIPKFINKKNVKRYFSSKISDFNKTNFKELGNSAKHLIRKDVVGWEDIEVIWKTASIKIIEEKYEKIKN